MVILAQSYFGVQYAMAKKHWPIADKIYESLGWRAVNRSKTGGVEDREDGIDVFVDVPITIHQWNQYTRFYLSQIQEKLLSYETFTKFKYLSMVVGVEEFFRISPDYLSALYINKQNKIGAACIFNYPAAREYTAQKLYGMDWDPKKCEFIKENKKNGHLFIQLPFAMLATDPLAKKLGVIFAGPFTYDEEFKRIYRNKLNYQRSKL